MRPFHHGQPRPGRALTSGFFHRAGVAASFDYSRFDFAIDAGDEPNAPAVDTGDEAPTNLGDGILGASQATAANQPIWRGASTGWELGGDDFWDVANFEQSPTSVLWALVFEPTATGAIWAWHGDSDSPALELGVVGSAPSYIRWRVRDSNVKENSIQSTSITLGERYAVVAYAELNGTQELWVNDSSGPVATAARSDTGTFLATRRLIGARDTGTGASVHAQGNLLHHDIQDNGASTTADRSALMADLMEKWEVT